MNHYYIPLYVSYTTEISITIIMYCYVQRLRQCIFKQDYMVAYNKDLWNNLLFCSKFWSIIFHECIYLGYRAIIRFNKMFKLCDKACTFLVDLFAYGSTTHTNILFYLLWSMHTVYRSMLTLRSTEDNSYGDFWTNVYVNIHTINIRWKWSFKVIMSTVRICSKIVNHLFRVYHTTFCSVRSTNLYS